MLSFMYILESVLSIAVVLVVLRFHKYRVSSFNFLIAATFILTTPNIDVTTNFKPSLIS